MRSDMPGDHYGHDVLSRNWRRPKVVPQVEAERDLVVEDAETGFCGAVLRCEKTTAGWVVTLADRNDKPRAFPLGPGFLIDGQPVVLIPAKANPGPKAPTRTASGSVAVPHARARVARESRIYVEGKHDAELVEKVWGDDLRLEGVVVEYLEGIDDLPAIVKEFRPNSGRRLGVLVDHLVSGSKESRIVAQVKSPHVLIVGHPYIDVWQAVRPDVLGIKAWPVIPHGRPWKEGVIDALGWRLETFEAWKRILGSVKTWTDLEPVLLGRVEELIDFVTADTSG